MEYLETLYMGLLKNVGARQQVCWSYFVITCYEIIPYLKRNYNLNLLQKMLHFTLKTTVYNPSQEFFFLIKANKK